jgi:thiol-disulfide isomerase/thioredoxin
MLKAEEPTSIPVVDFSAVEVLLEHDNDTTYVINFWATWCLPCRRELPYFEEIHRNYREQKVKVILISLDFVSRIESSTLPFLKEKNITAEVILLNDPDSNSWIDKVDPSWSGALPATLFYKGDKRLFLEKEFDYESLERTIHEFLN